jgi:hypothetical protein
MLRTLTILFTLFAALHGLVHLAGLVAYWPLAAISNLPYKTTLLGGRWEVGAGGMRLFSLLWLLAAVLYLVAVLGLALGKPWWAPWMLAATLFSLVLCLLDWSAAWRGALIDLFLLLILFVVFGLRQQPAPFPPFSGAPGPLATAPLPADLPAPAARYYRLIYGDQVPIYHTAVLSGRGTLRFMGLRFPARWRFSHETGKNYRHYIEAAFYGLPIMKVNETYLDGHSRLELPFGVVENDPRVDSAANIGMWAEMGFFPASYLTEGRARWQALDETTARLHIPFGESEQVFTVRFDPQTGLIQTQETLRYLDEQHGEKRWWGEMIYENVVDGVPGRTLFTANWEHENGPWLVVELEEAVFNTDLSQYIRQRGP